MARTIEGVLDLHSPEAYMDMKATWAKNMKALGEVTTSISKAVADVKSRLGTRRAEASRAIKRKADDAEKSAIKKAREEATATAQAIKKQKQKDAQEVKSIFQAEFVGIKTMAEVSGDQVVPNRPQPFVRVKSEGGDLWAEELKVQKALTAFGGQYKRTEEAAGTGRTQHPFDDATGLTETMKMVETQNMSPPKLADLSKVAGGASFQESAWMFGYTPEMKFAGLGPTCAAIQRWLTLGGFHCLAIEVVSLVKYMAKSAGQQCDTFCPTLQEISWFVEALTTEKLKQVADDNVRMCQATITKQVAVYIPLGWYCVERSLPDHPVICGARKSYMTSDDDVQAYDSAKAIFAKSGRVVTRMEEIFQAMRDANASAEAAGPT